MFAVGDRVWRPIVGAQTCGKSTELLVPDVLSPIDTYLVDQIEGDRLHLDGGHEVAAAGWELYPAPGDRVVFAMKPLDYLYDGRDLDSPWLHQICVAGRSCPPPAHRGYGRRTLFVPRDGFAGACIEVRSPDNKITAIAVVCIRVYERSRSR